MNLTKEKILSKLRSISRNTLMETLEIEFIDVSEESIIARMPVTPKVHQPDGVLHGGATVALAESIGSAAAVVFMGADKVSIRGVEISANHVKSISDGYVYARTEVIHKGRTTQVWLIRVTNEDDELISLVKLTTIAIYN
jgi:uncharacterized protein (TIGR00369 family)